MWRGGNHSFLTTVGVARVGHNQILHYILTVTDHDLVNNVYLVKKIIILSELPSVHSNI